MSSTSNLGFTSNDSTPSNNATANNILTVNKTRNHQAFHNNQQLLSAKSSAAQQAKVECPIMNPKALAFAEPVIASSDRFADIAPYMGHMYNSDPKKWGNILPWEFPQRASKEVEEDFLRAEFGGLECHVQGFRFLKQVWYDIAKWNFEIRVPAVAQQWLDNNKDIWTDPTMVDFILKPSAELKTFSFTINDMQTYGEKLLTWVVKHIQYLVHVEQYKLSSAKQHGSAEGVETKSVQTPVLDANPVKHRPAPIVVDTKQPAPSADTKVANVTKSAQFARVLPSSVDPPPQTAPIRPLSSGERVSDVDISAQVPPGIQAGSDTTRGPALHHRKRGNSGSNRGVGTYDGGPDRFNQKWQPQAPFAALPYQQSPYRTPSFPQAAAPTVLPHNQMPAPSGGFLEYMPSQPPPPPGFPSAAPTSQFGPSHLNNGTGVPSYGIAHGPVRRHAPTDYPSTHQNPYYDFSDRNFGIENRSNGREGNRMFSGSNMPWSEHDVESFGGNRCCGKRRESMSSRGGSGRARGSSFGGRGGKGSRGRNSFSSGGRRGSEMFASDGLFQHNKSFQVRVPLHPGLFSSDARNARGNDHHNQSWGRRQSDTRYQENAQPTGVVPGGLHPPLRLQEHVPMTGTLPFPPPAIGPVNDRDVAESGIVTIWENFEIWTSPRLVHKRKPASDKERRELPVTPIHDPLSREAQENPERVLTETFIGSECSHVRKLILFRLPPSLPLEQIAIYFQDCVGLVDEIKRSYYQGPHIRSPHQCWITFASHLDAKKAISMTQSTMHSIAGYSLKMAVPFEYWKEDHKSYPGYELVDRDSISSSHESRSRGWNPRNNARQPVSASVSNGMVIPEVREDMQNEQDRTAIMPSEEATSVVQGDSIVSSSSTSTPAQSLNPTPNKGKNKNKSKKAKQSSQAAGVDRINDAKVIGESSSIGSGKLAAVFEPNELRKASESSAESRFQAASEPSLSPEITMKRQTATVSLSHIDHSPSPADHSYTENQVDRKDGLNNAIPSPGHGVAIEKINGDESAQPSPKPVTELNPAGAQKSNTTFLASSRINTGVDRARGGIDKRAASASESPEKSDVDDSFHTAADSPSEGDHRIRQDRSSEVSLMTDSGTEVASPVAKLATTDTVRHDNHQATTPAEVQAGDATESPSPASRLLGPDTKTSPPMHQAASAGVEEVAKQMKPSAVQINEPKQSAQGSMSFPSTVPPKPAFVTAPTTPAVTLNITPSSEQSTTAASQQAKKDSKPKGPPQTESLSLYSKKKGPKPKKQKPKKGGNRIASASTETESVDSTVISGMSDSKLQQADTPNDRVLLPQIDSVASANAVVHEDGSGVQPNDVPAADRVGGSHSSKSHPGVDDSAQKHDQAAGTCSSGSAPDVEPSQNQTSTKIPDFASGRSAPFLSSRPSDTGSQLEGSAVFHDGARAASGPADSSSSRPGTSVSNTGLAEIGGVPLHPSPGSRDGDTSRDSGDSGGQHDVPVHDPGHSAVGLGISSSTGESLERVDEPKSKTAKKKSKKKKRKQDGQCTDENGAEGNGLSVTTKGGPVATSQPSSFAFEFTSNSPVKLSEHDDVGRISHTHAFTSTINPSQAFDKRSDQSSQMLDGPIAQASRKPTPSSTAASDSSPMKKKIELLQGKSASKSVVEAPPVKRPASAASKHARRQGSIASAKSSETIAATGNEIRRASGKLLYLYKPKAPKKGWEELEHDQSEDSGKENLELGAESNQDGLLQVVVLEAADTDGSACA